PPPPPVAGARVVAPPGVAPLRAGPAAPPAPAAYDPVTDPQPDWLPLSSIRALTDAPPYRQLPDEVTHGAGQTVAVNAGDTLCGIAAAFHFNDCSILRAHPRNAGLKYRQIRPGDQVFVPSSAAEGTRILHTIRFIRGANAAEGALAKLNITNFNPERAGLDYRTPFPDDSVRGYHQQAWEDEDVFKIEVTKTNAAEAELPGKVKLRALRPVYDGGGRVTGHKLFEGAETEKRMIEVALSKQTTNSPDGFQSAYLRLASLAALKTKRPNQTLLVGSMGKDDSEVEVLDQKVRATYVLPQCTALESEQCHVEAELPLDKRKRVDVAIRVLREKPTGKIGVLDGDGDDGTCKLIDARQTFYTFVREVFAQAHIVVKVVRLETIDPPNDGLTIGNNTGAAAAANYTVEFSLVATRFANGVGTADAPVRVGPVAIPAGTTPAAAAALLQTAVDGKIPGVTGAASPNPPQCGIYDAANVIQAAAAPRASADLLLRSPAGVRVTIANLTLTPADTAQKVDLVQVDPETFIVANIPTGYHIGSPMFRVAFKQLDTGGHNIDVIFAKTMEKLPNPDDVIPPGETGRGTVDGFGLGALADFPGTHQPLAETRNSIVLTLHSSKSGKPYLAAHELGHVLIDNGLHVYAPGGDRNLVDHLMWAAPGDSLGVHCLLNDHDTPMDNWESFHLTAPNGWLDYSQPFRGTRINAVQRILGRAATNYLQDA
ncbi:MAG: hypothetical protein K2X35_21940, partial [Bryobacteraceae bacterium]|nr:hypothetical protein [Bryobacteraceae bacterium]